MDWDKASKVLSEKLDPKHIVKPSGNFGPKGDYIQGWHAIAEANRAFGFGGWSYTIKTLKQDSLLEVTGPKGPQWQAAYTCIVTVTVGDVVREDVGFGSGFAKQIGEAVEGATKEAVTDALKRALRTFGNVFGLALYDKTRDGVGVNPEPFNADETYTKIKTAIQQRDTIQSLDALWAHKATKEAFAQFNDDDKAALLQEYTTRMGELAYDTPSNHAP